MNRGNTPKLEMLSMTLWTLPRCRIGILHLRSMLTMSISGISPRFQLMTFSTTSLDSQRRLPLPLTFTPEKCAISDIISAENILSCRKMKDGSAVVKMSWDGALQLIYRLSLTTRMVTRLEMLGKISKLDSMRLRCIYSLDSMQSKGVLSIHVLQSRKPVISLEMRILNLIV